MCPAFVALTRRELSEQILADGGHVERSPMYHAIVLEDLLDLVQLTQCYPAVFPESDVGSEGGIYTLLRLQSLESNRLSCYSSGC